MSRKITWRESDLLLSELAKKVTLNTPLGGWKGIIAVSRGGLVPAGILAYKLDIKLVAVVGAESYEGKEQNVLKIIRNPHLNKESGHYLLVDDLVDTGGTIKGLRPILPSHTVAVLFAKPKGEEYADVYAEKAEQDQWITFPWE